MHGYPVMMEMSSGDIEAFNDDLNIGDPFNIAIAAYYWRRCEQQASEVSYMYYANANLTWNLFYKRGEGLSEDKEMEILGLVEPYFITIDFMMKVVCYRLEGHLRPEWGAAIGRKYLCGGIKKLCKVVLRLIAIRRIAGRQWKCERRKALHRSQW